MSVDELLDWLLMIEETAESFFTRIPVHQTGVARQAIDNERKQFGRDAVVVRSERA